MVTMNCGSKREATHNLNLKVSNSFDFKTKRKTDISEEFEFVNTFKTASLKYRKV